MNLPIETERLYISEFTLSLAESVHVNSLDEDNRRYVADEVFETVVEARQVICKLRKYYSRDDSPLVYPVFLNSGIHIGHVQAIPIESGWEIGYHIAKSFTGHGYATEAVKAFLFPVMKRLNVSKIFGICHADNIASIKVLEKCGFILKFKGEDYLQGKRQEMCRYEYNLE